MIKGVVPAVVTRICEPLKRQFAWTARRAPGAVFVVLAAFALAACTSEKDRLDAEARRLCAIDGGIKVFETVTLPPEKFHQYGQPLIPSGRDDKGFGYYIKGDQQHIAGQMSQLAGDGAGLKKHTYQIVRTADGKVMGESIVYRRHGGSWWDGLMEGDGFTCPEDKVNTTFMQQVFIKGTQGN